jgi:flavin reductase (DIM6/NTAB) family NADH-FMN oxidoreductase RutF
MSEIQRTLVPAAQAYHLINHGPCNLLTTGNGKIRNVAPINWTMPLNTDPARVISVVEEGTCTDRLIRETGEFAINVVGEEWAETMMACGRCHGGTVDKFELFGIAAEPCARIRPPRLKDSVAHLECRVIARHDYDDVGIFVAEVVYAEVRSDCWDGKALLPQKAKTLHHLNAGDFAVAERTVSVPKNAPLYLKLNSLSK